MYACVCKGVTDHEIRRLVPSNKDTRLSSTPLPPDLPTMPRAAAALPVFPQQFEVGAALQPLILPNSPATPPRAPPCPAV